MRYLVRACLVSLALVAAAGPLMAAPVSFAHTSTIAAGDHSTPTPSRSPWALVAYGLGALGAIKVKDTASIAKKFVTRASAASGDYKDGVAQAGGDFEAAAKASEDVWAQATTEAIANKRFGKGLNGAGAKYQKNAVNLGSQRYAPGVQNASDAYAAGVTPYLDTIKGLTLPPKGVRGSAANQQRANIVATELNKKRLAS